jgi:hypothetical protein
MTYSVAKRFEDKGFTLRAFLDSDTERIGPDCVYKYYMARGGHIVEKFESLAQAQQWIEIKELLE